MTQRIRVLINGVLVLGSIGAAGLVVLGWHELSTAALWGRLLIGIGLGGAVTIGVLFLLPLELRANLTLMGATILASLWIASWLLYEPELSPWELRQRHFTARARDAGVPFDTRPARQVIDELRKSGVDAAPTLSAPTIFSEDWGTEGRASDGPLQPDSDLALVPFAGRSRTTTVACNEQGDYLIVESDRYGYNNPDHVYGATSPVLILGDSFAFGFCAQSGHDIGNQLRARGAEVVNLGYPAAGPLIQLAQLREYGGIIKPSVILWLYYHGNDLVNLHEENSEPTLRRYLDAGHHQNLAARQAEIDAFWIEYVKRQRRRHSRPRPPLGHILLLQPLRYRLTGRTLAAPRPPELKAPIDRFEVALDAIVAEADALDATLYFVFLPAYGRFAGRTATLEEDRDEVLTAVRSRGLPIIDFEAKLLETGDPLDYFPFRKGGHYTDAAYALMAEQILDHLR